MGLSPFALNVFPYWNSSFGVSIYTYIYISYHISPIFWQSRLGFPFGYPHSVTSHANVPGDHFGNSLQHLAGPLQLLIPKGVSTWGCCQVGWTKTTTKKKQTNKQTVCLQICKKGLLDPPTMLRGNNYSMWRCT